MKTSIEMQQAIARLERGLQRFGAVQCDQCGEWVHAEHHGTLKLNRSISQRFEVICYDCVISGLSEGSEFVEYMQKQDFSKRHNYYTLCRWWAWEKANAETYARGKDGRFIGERPHFLMVSTLVEQAFKPLRERCHMWQAAMIYKADCGAFPTFERAAKAVLDGKVEAFWKDSSHK